MKNLIFVLLILTASANSFAASAWLTCSSADAKLRRNQTNYPNGFSASVWNYKGTDLKAIELATPKSAVEDFDENTKNEIEKTETLIKDSDGIARKRTDTYFSSKVTVSIKDGSDLDPLGKITSVTENVICNFREIE